MNMEVIMIEARFLANFLDIYLYSIFYSRYKTPPTLYF